MDKQGAVFITKNYGSILALFLITSLLLLRHQNATFSSTWSYRKINQVSPEIAPSPCQPAQDRTVAVAPTPTSYIGTLNESSRTVPSPSRSPNPTLENSRNVSSSSRKPNATNTSSLPTPNLNTHTPNKLLDGLLQLGFDDGSCLSRYSSHLYRNPTPHKPSTQLLSKLRAYERLHRRCGPKSRRYTSLMRKPNRPNQASDCNYIVWFPANGLGNRMISLASTLLYALLTNRVLLAAFESDMLGLFCEPFFNSSWTLPQNFPHRHHIEDLPNYSTLVTQLLGSQNAANSISFPPFLFVDLAHHKEENERFFHCGEGQLILNRSQFLFMRSDQYFAPSLFMVPSFEAELDAMFPERDTVFHHLGRYLYSPSNEPWRRITDFYDAKMSNANKRVGIQVRVFAGKVTPAKTITEQILACSINNGVLPRGGNDTSPATMAVLVTSLHEEYSKRLRDVYSAKGEAVRVYQPSHEEVQRSYNNSHNVEALTEMYLLSLCEELVTSGRSTFGYVAQGLGGLKAWIMYVTVGTKFREPACEKGLSMEPCFHFPPRYDCERRVGVEHMSSVYRYMKRCEDVGSGLKMVAKP